MRVLILSILISLSSGVFAQSKLAKIADQIESKGRALYRLEMAAWHGSDLMLEKYPEVREKGRGYLAYALADKTHFVFYGEGDNPKVIFDVAFESTFDLGKVKIDLEERALSKLEKRLYQARLATANYVENDTTFKQYQNAAFNVIPVPSKKGTVVYILTGPKVNGVVIFGNDYKLVVDKKHRVKDVKKIHTTIIPVESVGKEKIETTMHTHLASTGDFITATDVCTLLLYGKFVKWKHHVVISEKYVSSWDVERQSLVILDRKVWEKIGK